jgi:hypothetical protein
MDEDTLLEVVYRRDGTYDFKQAPGVGNELVVAILRGIAEQIVAGVTIENL